MPTLKNKSAPAQQRARVRRIIDRLEKAHPDARLDLDFANPLELLIALILAAQARDNLVRQITPDLFNKYRTAEDYAKAPLAELEQQIGKINFYRNNAKAIHNCCNELVKRFGGKVPNICKIWFPSGVGRKTTNIVLGNAFGQDTIGVDTHVMRLAQRLELSGNTHPDKIEDDLTPIVPETRRVRFCHLLQYHGRRICVAKKPKCRECTIRGLCPYPAKTNV